MRKTPIFIVAFFGIVIFATLLLGCSEERVTEQFISQEKIDYANAHYFNWRIVIDEQEEIISKERNQDRQWLVLNRIEVTQDTFDPSYTELVFVGSEEKARDFPDTTVVAWPDSEAGQGFINSFNLAILLHDIDPGEFGLSYPLEVEDLAYKWEEVLKFRSEVGEIFAFYADVRDIAEEGSDFNRVQLEILQLAGNAETHELILEKGWELLQEQRLRRDGERGVESLLRLGLFSIAETNEFQPILDLLIAAGSVEAFLEAADYALAEGISIRRTIAELEAAND